MYVYQRKGESIRLLAKVPKIQSRSKLHDCVLAKLKELGEKYCFKADKDCEDVYYIFKEQKEVQVGVLYNTTTVKLIKEFTFGLTALHESAAHSLSCDHALESKKSFLEELKEQIAKMQAQPLVVDATK